MNPIALAFLLSIYGFVAYLITHTLYFRFFHPQNRMQSLNRLVGKFIPILLVLYTATTMNFHFQPGNWEIIWPLLLSFILFLIFHIAALAFYSAVGHSVRIRLTVELYKQGAKGLDLPKILTLYSPEQANFQRILQLVDGGYATRQDQMITLTKKGICIAKLAVAGRQFFHVPDHDFSHKISSDENLPHTIDT